MAFALSQTMVVPALPAIAQEYGTSRGGAAWVLTGFLLSASVATPIAGKLGDVLGKGRVLAGVLLAFSARSVVSGLADAFGPLVAGRVLQGVAGGVFPLALGIIRDTFPSPRLGVGIGSLSAMFGIGLPLAGVLVDSAGVSPVFWSGLIAAPAALAAWRFVPASPSREGSASVDWAGAVGLSAALAAPLLALSQSNAWDWSSPATLGLLGGGLAALVGWVRLELGRDEPLVDIRLLSTRAVAATNLTGFLVGFAMFSSFLLIPQFARPPCRPATASAPRPQRRG
ncbi:MAG TPA: MFS transporter [Solirubrobacteraceae bacterium]|nr:MFS transporter [Solirubrobacteraceae bacterium]